ncbi:MAG: hypothetical protein RI906_3355 [Pseudomonadota bacterium]|jgi:acetone carboxylase gamma subunit
MSQRRISPALAQQSGRIVCMHCSHDLGPAGQPWKHSAKLSTQPVCQLPGAGSGVNPSVVLRRFACPGCATLLDSEVALPDDPFLDDVVLS